MDDHQKKFVSEAQQRANEVIASGRLNAEVQDILKTMLIVSDMAIGLLSSSTGQSADNQYQKRKNDAVRADLIAAQKSLDNIKTKMIPSIIGEIKLINQQVATLLSINVAPEDKSRICAEEIKQASQRIVESFTK